MFNKLKTIKKFNDEIISIDDLYDIVKNNTQKDIINNIRSVEYKSKEYNNLKLRVNAITPHGVFNSLKNEGLIKLSGYLYYDIDGFDTEIELNDTIQKLLNENCISFLCKSVGNKGISFMVKVDDTNFELNDTNFIDIYSYVRNIFIDKGYNIDLSANGLVRKMIISRDENAYLNNKVSLSIDKVSFKIYQESLRQVKKLRNIKTEERIDITLNDTNFEIIDLDILLKEINIETLYTKEIEGDFVIEEMDYYKILIPKEIKDGNKHRLYIRIINALYYINSSITKQQVYSYLFYVNNMATPKMNDYELKRLVNNICNNIETTGEIKIKPRVKRLHFNKQSGLTKKQKQNMGGQLGSKVKNNNSIRLIKEAIIKCELKNETPTRQRIANDTGLSLSTVKRNWNKEYNDLTDIKINKGDTKEEIILERENKLNEILIDEEDFWDGFKTNGKYIEPEFIDTDFGDGIDIEDFLEGSID